MEISNLSDAEFKTLTIRMLNELSEDLNSIKMIQAEMKDTLIEMKISLQGNKSRMDETKNHLEHKKSKNCQSQQQEEKRIQKNEDIGISSLWANFKNSNIAS